MVRLGHDLTEKVMRRNHVSAARIVKECRNRHGARGADQTTGIARLDAPVRLLSRYVPDNDDSAVSAYLESDTCFGNEDIDAHLDAFDNVASCPLQPELSEDTVIHAVSLCKGSGIKTILKPDFRQSCSPALLKDDGHSLLFEAAPFTPVVSTGAKISYMRSNLLPMQEAFPSRRQVV